MSEQPPAPEQEEELKGWPHQAIQDLDAGERDALLQAGGPVGESARLAWQQYQHQQKLQSGEDAGTKASGEGSGVGEQESPPAPPKATRTTTTTPKP